MHWKGRMLRNARRGALVYVAIVVAVTLLTLMSRGLSGDWPRRLAGVLLFAFLGGAVIGAGCTGPERPSRASSVLIILASAVSGSIIVFPLLLMLTEATLEQYVGAVVSLFTAPALVVTSMVHYARFSKNTRNSGS